MESVGGKYLTFYLENEEYGIPIKKVKEIIGMLNITNIPKMPNYVKGVINLRGKIIPVMDLRLKFGMEVKEYNQRTCIVVVELFRDSDKKHIGIIVDKVSEVSNIVENEIENAPQYNSSMDSEFLLGIGKVKGRIILMLNIDKVLSLEEMTIIQKN
jgi:purine-binding chemotaxis protein CheW